MRPRRRSARGHLQRHVFFFFALAIIVSAALAAVVVAAFSPGRDAFRDQLVGAQRFAAERFGEVWSDPAELRALGRAVQRDLRVNLVFYELDGRVVERFGVCTDPDFSFFALEDGRRVGKVEACDEFHSRGRGHAFIVGLLAVVLVMWTAAGLIARRLTRPLEHLIRVTRAIGSGRLQDRVRLPHFHAGELKVLADSVSEMAVRIERQLRDQRELLAAVSHELRTPLGHLRILSELLRDSGAKPELLAEIDQEISEVDALVDQLLASSKLDFQSLDRRKLNAKDVAERALERAGLGASLLKAETPAPMLSGDPSLLQRALANLLRNAEEHAGGATELRVFSEPNQVCFEVCDAGPGFGGASPDQLFSAFFRKEHRSGTPSLGLGLALVKRIAEAHGGRAWARSLSKGAAVGFSVRRDLGGPSDGEPPA